MALASYITLLRVVLILPIIYLTYLQGTISICIALFLFLIAGGTDYLDGYVARKTQTESSLGALLDLLADKLLVCLILIWLIYFYRSFYFIIPVLIIVARELAMSSARQFAYEKKKGEKFFVSYLGKSKTTLQFISISILIISPLLGPFFYGVGVALLWIAALSSIYSMYDYLNRWVES